MVRIHICSSRQLFESWPLTSCMYTVVHIRIQGFAVCEPCHFHDWRLLFSCTTLWSSALCISYVASFASLVAGKTLVTATDEAKFATYCIVQLMPVGAEGAAHHSAEDEKIQLILSCTAGWMFRTCPHQCHCDGWAVTFALPRDLDALCPLLPQECHSTNTEQAMSGRMNLNYQCGWRVTNCKPF